MEIKVALKISTAKIDLFLKDLISKKNYYREIIFEQTLRDIIIKIMEILHLNYHIIIIGLKIMMPILIFFVRILL